MDRKKTQFTLLFILCLFFANHTHAEDVASPIIERVSRLEVEYLFSPHGEILEHDDVPYPLIKYNGVYYLAYGNNLFKFPDFPNSFEYESLDLPDSEVLPVVDGLGYRFILNLAQEQLFLSVGRSSLGVDRPEEVAPRLFVLNETGQFHPVYTPLIVHYGILGYSHLSIDWLADGGDNLLTSAGGNLTVSPNATGPFTFLNGFQDEIIGSQRVFHDDRLVIQHGTNSIFQGVFKRGVLNEQYDGWDEIPPGRTPPEIHDVLLDGRMEGGEIFALERQYGTGDLWGGQENRILRSRDNGVSLMEVEGFFVDRTDPSDLTYAPVIQHIVFPTTHANQILIGGHESYGLYQEIWGRNFLSWSQDDGETWQTLTPLLDDWDRMLTPIVFIHETEDGQLFAGRVISRTMDPEGPFLEILRITLPDPAAESFPKAKLRQQGWRVSPTLGNLYTGQFPWVWIHDQQVWIYVFSSHPDGFPAFEYDLGWYWTSETLYPHVFSFDFDSYLYISRESGADRWIYRYSDQSWFRASVEGNGIDPK